MSLSPTRGGGHPYGVSGGDNGTKSTRSASKERQATPQPDPWKEAAKPEPSQESGKRRPQSFPFKKAVEEPEEEVVFSSGVDVITRPRAQLTETEATTSLVLARPPERSAEDKALDLSLLKIAANCNEDNVGNLRDALKAAGIRRPADLEPLRDTAARLDLPPYIAVGVAVYSISFALLSLVSPFIGEKTKAWVREGHLTHNEAAFVGTLLRALIPGIMATYGALAGKHVLSRGFNQPAVAPQNFGPTDRSGHNAVNNKPFVNFTVAYGVQDLVSRYLGLGQWHTTGARVGAGAVAAGATAYDRFQAGQAVANEVKFLDAAHPEQSAQTVRLLQDPSFEKLSPKLRQQLPELVAEVARNLPKEAYTAIFSAQTVGQTLSLMPAMALYQLASMQEDPAKAAEFTQGGNLALIAGGWNFRTELQSLAAGLGARIASAPPAVREFLFPRNPQARDTEMQQPTDRITEVTEEQEAQTATPAQDPSQQRAGQSST